VGSPPGKSGTIVGSQFGSVQAARLPGLLDHGKDTVQTDKTTTRRKDFSKNMKKILLVFGAILLCGIPALAQEYPKTELFMGYEFVRFNPSLASSGNPSVNMHGGGGSVGINFTNMFGLKAEFTGAGIGDNKVCSSTGLNCLTRSFNFFTYMFGPQITFRQNPKVQPFFHVLFGGAYSNYYADIKSSGTISTGPTMQDAGKQAFALAAGGGIDVKVSDKVAIRLAQFDYFMTRFSGRYVDTAGTGSVGGLEINNQNNFRYMAGINIHIGKRQ
jgi:opacity protein-like surface antigen